MLRSCKYCGGVHDSKYVCLSKPKRDRYKVTYIDRFRWTKVWQKKRKQINDRDKYMCQVCMRKLYNTEMQYNFKEIEVHHIVAIVEDWDLRLEDSNLICLCVYHHKMAESGEIGRAVLNDIVEEQEKL